MTSRSRLWSLMLTASLMLGGCAVVPVDDYGYYEDDAPYYTRETVIVTPPPRVEYRGLPPASSYIWIDGYWNWVGHRHDWVPGYWAPPGTRARAIVRHRQFDRDRDDDRRDRWWREHRNTRNDDRRDSRDDRDRKPWREDGRRDDARRDGDRDGWPRRGDERERTSGEERLQREAERRRTRDSEAPRRFEGRPLAPQAAPAGDARSPRTVREARDGPRDRDGIRDDAREERSRFRRDDTRSDERAQRRDGPRTEGRGERRANDDDHPRWRDRL
ncbi:MAG: YXWGXW repeat-containing protein, partial [Thauera sp.]